MINRFQKRERQFGVQLTGETIVPTDPDYDSARRVWNAMIDRRPALIVRCRRETDVAPAVRFAREHQLELAVRGGGHNIAGSAVCDGGLVIDLSRLTEVVVDPQRRRATVQAGATLADVDAATQAHGLAVPLGINSTTGIAGLTLGGGFGWLTRQYGLTIDHLVSANVVTAAGERVRASADQNADLFWAIRGGGGNFGVVTRFEFRLHPVGPAVFAGLLVFPFEEAGAVLRQYRGFVDEAPESFNAWVVVRHAPPLPFLPERVHGQLVVALAVFHTSPPDEAEGEIAPLRDFGTLLGAHVGSMPYIDWQQTFDALLTPGARNYWKSHNFTELNDGALACLQEFAVRLPTPASEIFVGLVGGAANRVAADATAYAHRDARFVMNVHTRWNAADDDGRCIEWARQFFKASAPFASAGAYVNFMTEEESARVAAAYGVNHARLLALKRKFDPQNLLHMNQNIKP